MRKICLSLFAAVMFLFCSMSIASADTMMLEYDGGMHEYDGAVYSLVVNNRLIDPPLSPIIFNDRALVPVREIFEEVGATVNYEGDTQTVEIFGDNSYVRMQINDNVAYVNGDKTNIPDNVVPKLISKVGGETKTMVPVRFISETIGLDVEFDSADDAILIDSDGFTLAEPTPEPTPAPRVHVTDVSYEVSDETNVSVAVYTDIAFDTYSDFMLENPERIVIDIAGAKLAGINDTRYIGKAGVASVRLGDNDERARAVIDVESLEDYSVERTSDTCLTIYVTTKAAPEPIEEETEPTPAPTKKPAVSKPSAGKKLIVLDAGHGGTDSGAVGYLDGNQVLEKNLTLQITNKVKRILENAGYDVSMTRTGDTLPSLVERPTQANEEGAAVFVSIHINSVDNAPSANGTEVFYAESNNGDEYGATSRELAQNILERMLYYMGSTNRGVKTAEHAVTKRCDMPAALAEVGFITNPIEVYNMTTDEYQSKAAQGIAEGIMITLRDIEYPD